MIQTVQLTRMYNAEEGFQQVSFSTQPSEILAVLGRNGAGKSSLIRCLMGFDLPDSGSLTLLGMQWPKDRIRLLNQIGYVQDPPLFAQNASMGELSVLGCESFTHWDTAYFTCLMDRFQLSPHKKFGELSRGMRVKFNFAFALAYHPRVLILDEPTSGLDPITREEILGMLVEFASHENKTIIYTTHILEEVERIATHVLILRQSKPVAMGPLDQIKASRSLKTVFDSLHEVGV